MPTRRAFVFPVHGDTLATVAGRVFPDDAVAAGQFASWNLHLAYRRSPSDDPGVLLPTDIVYTEAPLP